MSTEQAITILVNNAIILPQYQEPLRKYSGRTRETDPISNRIDRYSIPETVHFSSEILRILGANTNGTPQYSDNEREAALGLFRMIPDTLLNKEDFLEDLTRLYIYQVSRQEASGATDIMGTPWSLIEAGRIIGERMRVTDETKISTLRDIAASWIRTSAKYPTDIGDFVRNQVREFIEKTLPLRVLQDKNWWNKWVKETLKPQTTSMMEDDFASEAGLADFVRRSLSKPD